MNGITIEVRGNWGHFKKPETNNNPLTHDLITKTATIGMIGAVLGKDRPAMATLFPQLSEDLLYGVRLLAEVRKESWAFTLRRAVNLYEKAPKQMEFLKRPGYLVALAAQGQRSWQTLDDFAGYLSDSRACFTPVLGLHNCPADISLRSKGEFVPKAGLFSTGGFIVSPLKANVDAGFRVGVDRIPTYQSSDFYNPPERYRKVFYPAAGSEISAEGEYFEYTDGSKWVLI
jgi:CRISPR-associated protein Cas5h